MYNRISYEELVQLEKLTHDTVFLPLCQRMMAFMDFRNWNPLRFHLNTNLDMNTYSKLKNNHMKRPDMRTFIAICAGLRLPYHIIEDLLRSARMTFSYSKEDQAYRYVVLIMHGASIDECNTFLREQGVPLLGSIACDERESA